MPETKPTKRPTKNRKKSIFFGRFFPLLFKQTITSLVCIAIVFGMFYSKNQTLLGYTKALGNAIRYEVNTEGLQQSGSAIFSWLLERFSKEREGTDHE